MKIIQSIISLFSAIVLFFTSIPNLFCGMGTAEIKIDASKTSDIIPNIVDNVNVWEMGSTFFDAERNDENDVFEFVKYIQLMQCTGGSAERDLFKNPLDNSVLDDYDFSRLIKNCRGILKIGAKPHLKLGNVPLKLSSAHKVAGMTVNVYPPDDYNEYYTYIKAIAEALVTEFGLEEVRTWRFGCMTEYENSDWFQANVEKDDKDLLGRETAIAYCKLYDYTVKALTDVLGEDVFVGAHSMTVTEGIWDERIFIDHVANGTNYATGKKGTPIKFLSASFYDSKPGTFTSGKTLPETVAYLKDYAESAGLKNLIYGIDEGRILEGNVSGADSTSLNARITGYTWQAAYDARLFKQGIDSGLNYFSSWQFLSGGLFAGNPTVSYHVAKNISEFAGSRKTETKVTAIKPSLKSDIDCLSAWDEATGTLRLMLYNFKNDISYKKEIKTNIPINVPQFDGKEVTVTKKVIDDNCNFFDEWQQDRIKYGITDDCFAWSPEDPIIESGVTLSDENARKIYFDVLREKYAECARLTPTESILHTENSTIEIEDKIGASNVVFYEIKIK